MQVMRSTGYTDVEYGECSNSKEHLTVTQFKVQQEQKHFSSLAEKTEQKAQEVASLEKRIEKIRKQQSVIQSVEQIDIKTVPLSPSKVLLERSEYETLATPAKIYIT